MLEEHHENRVGEYLLELIQSKSLSMRKLSKATGIDTAIISKIVNGKRKANLQHLQKFSEGLDVPLYQFLKVAGYVSEDNNFDKTKSDLQESADHIQSLLKAADAKDIEFSLERMEHLLSNYQDYSKTDEGKLTILNGFKEKLTKIGSTGPYIQKLEKMYEAFRLQKGTTQHLLLMGSALLYFIFTIDIVPDYFFPVGYLDDALVVQYITSVISMKE
ncbi:DUF1232 domain-containing protein [Ornithinibacillus sp. L9]|uniref:DUF1232 domain-containing protein n=1 Tax=Ornithinibacillus caprae TaxID=2678566 RepID=A0A6N8FL59_9BACI|nr:DUF1232 domain-containing protein [Ornithinibacillus caprae]MUK90380.1 DUF1232 domain-containing protein [Ornithinibacillus caprae]